MKKLILLHTDTFKDSIISDNLFIVALIVLVFSLVFLLYRFIKK